MIKAIAIGVLFCSLGMSHSSDKKVYVCISPNSKTFHLDEQCPTLKRCKHDVIVVTKTDAVAEYHRILCENE